MLLVTALFAVAAATQSAGPTPAASPSPRAAETPPPSPVATPSPTPNTAETPPPDVTPTPSAAASPSPEESPSPEPSPSPTATPSPLAAVRVARLVFIEDVVEHGSGSTWEVVQLGQEIRTGDRIRVSPRGMARVEFPWMDVTAGPDAILFIPKAFLLSTVLEAGRIEMSTGESEIVKLRTAEAEVRGKGRIVVRREGKTTLVAAITGNARVRAARKTVVLKGGEGTSVRSGEVPRDPRPLPPPPEGISPGTDPLYVRKGVPVTLSWTAGAASYHVQLLEHGTPEILLEREAKGSSLTLDVPWPGTFRWRVSARNAQGLEGPPSPEGLICVFDW